MTPIIRTLSFLEQWTAEVVRQPGLMFTLVLAPFLLLFAFGEGVEIGGSRPTTLIVQPPNAETPIEPLLEGLHREVPIVGITESEPLARRALEVGDVEAVAIVPADPNSYIARGQQAPLRVLLAEIDPVRHNFALAYLKDQVAALNQRVVAEALGQAQGQVGVMEAASGEARTHVGTLRDADDRDDALAAVRALQLAIEPLQPDMVGAGAAAGAFAIPGLAPPDVDPTTVTEAVQALHQDVDALESRLSSSNSDEGATPAEVQRIEDSLNRVDGSTAQLGSVDPAVLSAPFVLQVENITPVPPGFTSFYSPGVLALLIHHLAITLAALTLARMRVLRVTDILRVAPVQSLEIVLGNYLSYAVLCGLSAAALFALVVLVLEVPVIGDYAMVALVLGLLIFCALGVGFLASQLSSSVQQAAQIAMLILLASVFFGGFAFSLDRITWPFQAISYALPASYAIRALQDVMLRGFEPALVDLAVLGVAGLVLLVINVALLRRAMAAT